MEFYQIKAIGNFLGLYYTDLCYFRNFQRYLREDKKSQKYVEKGNDSFYDFLVNYRIIRNIDKGKTGELLELTEEWLKDKSNHSNVGGFVTYLGSKTLNNKGNKLNVLASKVLFLNNPIDLYPMDGLAQKALEQKNSDYNNYTKYASNLLDYQKANQNEINECLNSIQSLTDKIEDNFNNYSKDDLEKIRCNRFLDILLWTKGQGL